MNKEDSKEEIKLPQRRKAGRTPKSDPAIFRYAISLNEVENAAFLGRFDESGMTVKAHFITASIFNKHLKVVRLDKGSMDYYMRLTTFYSQFRAIGVNYNQVVKSLRSSFPEKRALVMLAKLEKATIELVTLNRKIMNLTEKLEVKIYGSSYANSESIVKNKKE
jgi:hypothetical protein